MRRKKNWKPYLLLPLALILGFSIVSKKLKFPHKKIPVVVKTPSKTWSGFDQYHRLKMVIDGFAIQSVIDIPSCDLETLKHHDFGLKQYLGVTASKEQAMALQALNGSNIRSFISLRPATDLLPEADLIIGWDLLCTLSPSDIRSTLYQFKKSGAKFLLMRQCGGVEKNHKNRTGDFQPINWKLPPHNFPEPLIHIPTSESGDECLALWSIDSLP